MAMARRGADVVAVDLSPTLVGLARERTTPEVASGSVRFVVGDMLATEHGEFDHVVAMDSLIHYRSDDMVRAVASLAQRTRCSLLFTFAPRTPALAMMHAIGRMFPRADRAPAIEPVAYEVIRGRLAPGSGPNQWRPARTERIVSGFYTSQLMEMLPT